MAHCMRCGGSLRRCGGSLLEMWWLIVTRRCGGSLKEMWWLIEEMWGLIIGDVVAHCN